MATYTQDQVKTIVTREIKGISDDVSSDDIDDAIVTMLAELSPWSFPVSSDFRFYWMKDRIKRHIIYAMLFDSSKKFKVKQYSLQQKFENFLKLLKTMDEAFQAAQDENAAEFAGVDSYKMFGQVMDAGFAYDETGRDITYEDDQYIGIKP